MLICTLDGSVFRYKSPTGAIKIRHEQIRPAMVWSIKVEHSSIVTSTLQALDTGFHIKFPNHLIPVSL